MTILHKYDTTHIHIRVDGVDTATASERNLNSHWNSYVRLCDVACLLSTCGVRMFIFRSINVRWCLLVRCACVVCSSLSSYVHIETSWSTKRTHSFRRFERWTSREIWNDMGFDWIARAQTCIGCTMYRSTAFYFILFFFLSLASDWASNTHTYADNFKVFLSLYTSLRLILILFCSPFRCVSSIPFVATTNKMHKRKMS